MKKEIKVLKKLEQMLKQLNCRSYMHQFGPKKFKLKHHLLALLMMQVCKFSLRRIEKFLRMFGIKVPTYSALCKSRKKIPSAIWNNLVQITSGLQHANVAIDATGFSTNNPSLHYIKRIDRINPVKRYAKMSMLFNVDKNKIIAIHVRTKPAHETRDVKYLLSKKKIKCLLGDKAYDAEWLHRYCYEKGIQTIIPKKINIYNGRFRKKQMVNYSEEKYHRRSLIESGFSAVKRKYGSSVFGKSLSSIKTELYCKAIAHNLLLRS